MILLLFENRGVIEDFFERMTFLGHRHIAAFCLKAASVLDRVQELWKAWPLWLLAINFFHPGTIVRGHLGRVVVLLKQTNMHVNR